MAEVVKDTTRVGMDPSSGMYASQISGKLAGEAIAKGDAVYLKSDGKLWKSDGSADAAACHAVGLAADAAAVNEAVTAWGAPSIWDYSAGLMTPGAPLYLGAGGKLDDAQALGHPGVFAQAIDAFRIRVVTDYALWT